MGIRRGRLVEQPLTPFLRLSPPAPETTAPQPIVSPLLPGPRVSPTTRARSPNEDIRPPPPPCVSLLLLPSPLRDQGEEARPVQLIRNQPRPPNPHHLRQDAWNRQHPRRAVDEPLQCDPRPSRPGLCLARGQGRPRDGCRYVLIFSPLLHIFAGVVSPGRRCGSTSVQSRRSGAWRRAVSRRLSGGRHRRPGRVGRFTPTPSPAAARGTPHPTTTHPLSAISSGPCFGWHGD